MGVRHLVGFSKMCVVPSQNHGFKPMHTYNTLIWVVTNNLIVPLDFCLNEQVQIPCNTFSFFPYHLWQLQGLLEC